MKYILDTNTIIDYLKGNSNIQEHMVLCSDRDIYISIITKAELKTGMKFQDPRSKEYKLNLAFLEEIRTINLDDAIIDLFSSVKAKLLKTGKVIPDFDILIGVTAVTYGYVLVTANEKHLSRVPSLQIENWHK